MNNSENPVGAQPKRRRWRAAMAVGMAASVGLAACGSSAAKSASVSPSVSVSNSGSTANKPTGTIRIGLSGAMDRLAPLPFGISDFEVWNDLYSTPVTISSGQPQPALVQSWKMASDGSSLTLHLRSGLTFSDGTPLDTSTLVWNINWEEQPANASHSALLWKSVTPTAVSSTTLKLAFAHPLPAIYGMLAGMPIVKPNAPTSGVSSGPFMVSKFVPGTSLTVVTNPHYWGTPAHAQSIIFTNYADGATAALALRSGTINLLMGPPATQLASLKAAGDKMMTGLLTSDGYTPDLLLSLLVNTSNPSLSDPRVRQALSLAFNRSQFVSTALSGQGVPQDSVFYPQSKAYVAPSGPSFDLTKAKSLLQQAGVSHLTLTVDTVSILPQSTFMPVYQQDLAKIGVTLKINQIDPAEWATEATNGTYADLLTQGNEFSDTDPAINFGNLDMTGQSQHFSSPQYTQMLQAAAQETNQAKRLADYKAIGQYLQKQMFIIPLVSGSTSLEAAYSPKVSDVHPAVFSSIDFAALRIG